VLTIRPTQVVALASTVRDRFVRQMCSHLQTHFPGPVACQTPAELEHTIRRCLAAAEGYGLVSERDACRYLNLAAHYGWNFDRDPDLVWMRQRLRDATSGPPSERLESLVAECVRRQAVARANAAMRWRAGVGSSRFGKRSDRRSRGSLAQGLLYTQLDQDTSSQRAQVNPKALGAAHQRPALSWNNDLPPLMQEKER
jgi:hypothetical protein